MSAPRLTPADRAWLLRAFRRVVREELDRAADRLGNGESVVQVGGYDGATVVADDESGSRRRQIGFVALIQEVGPCSGD